MCLSKTLKERSFFIMEFESIKRLGLDHIGIDTQKSFETYDKDTNNHIIIIHLLKSKILFVHYVDLILLN